ncbi:MarR family winged helix-turn-helix transcriptional regulator [Dysgonomonas sp. 511]|uniref:MarR family winged helix-turn-helix transcriptional regulator n=1 Tax=Dysgonomonas sp. 511 TaxID=2302930 RepID=UPI0013D63494|nr:MarR family winged helix-turn-helix transcriptional regulator [Dysgonomonas sp. 511]NDV78870.1 MarR family transcriptional regulator [Dysgonomonas sp. 511]
MEPICKLKDIYKALYNFEKEFAETNGITINEGMLLCCLKDGKPRSANELCDFVGLSNSRVSRIITAVEDKGYINREMGAVDKRQMIFSLTTKGIEKTKEMQAKKLDFSELVSLIKILEE